MNHSLPEIEFLSREDANRLEELQGKKLIAMSQEEKDLFNKAYSIRWDIIFRSAKERASK